MTNEYEGQPDRVWAEPTALSGACESEPTEEELAAAPLLEQWSVVAEGSAVFLLGCVVGHPRLADGAFIKTSTLQWIAADRAAARTLKRWYRLGVSAAEELGEPGQFFS